MYAQSRFYRSDSQFKGADGRIRQAVVYSYESHSVLYDMLLIEGMKFVRVNCGGLSNMICNWKPAHYAIERHFELEKAGSRER